MTTPIKIEVRMSLKQKNAIKKRAVSFGFSNTSEFIRIISLYGDINLKNIKE